MKGTDYIKFVVISLGISAGVLIYSQSGSAACPQSANSDTAVITEPCTTSGPQTWLNWFKGKSRSTQFHFVDLLELLNRLNSPSQNNN